MNIQIELVVEIIYKVRNLLNSMKVKDKKKKSFDQYLKNVAVVLKLFENREEQLSDPKKTILESIKKTLSDALLFLEKKSQEPQWKSFLYTDANERQIISFEEELHRSMSLLHLVNKDND